MKTEKKRYINGVNNIDYWAGKSEDSARNHIFHYYESKLMATRMEPWKWHFSIKEDYYANVVSRTAPLVFNIRMDPFESDDNKDSYGHLLQKTSWMLAPLGEHYECASEDTCRVPAGARRQDLQHVKHRARVHRQSQAVGTTGCAAWISQAGGGARARAHQHNIGK